MRTLERDRERQTAMIRQNLERQRADVGKTEVSDVMSNPRLRHPLAFGVIYMALSMVIEIALLVVGRLRIPDDNSVIAPILLIVSPVAAALICGYRRPTAVITLAILTIATTLACVMGFGRLTGMSTGLAPPIVLRTLAGSLAAALSARLSISQP